MKKFLTSKLVIIMTVLILLVVFNALVFNVSVVNRNIVVGLGLDFDGTEYTLHTQVVLPKNGGVASGGGNNYITLKTNAQNINIAIDKIEKEQGVILSLAQAAILVLGKSMVETGDLTLVEAFFMDDRVHDNLLLVMAEDKAEDVMNATVAAGEVASLQLVRQLSPTKAPLGVSTITMQEYIRNAKNSNKINYMPMISVEKTEPSTDQSKGNEDEADKFLITQSALLDNNGLQCLLDLDMTQTFSLVKKSLQDGVIKVEGEDFFSVHLVESKTNLSYDLDLMECKVKIKIKTIRTDARYINGKVSFKLSDEEQERLKQSLDTRVKALYEYAKAQKVDAFSIVDGFKKKYPKKSSQIMADDFLDNINLKVEVTITQVE